MDLTILIPTKDRFVYLKNLIEYYQTSNFKGKILIIDGSKKLIQLKIKKFILDKENVDYCYFNDPISISIKKSKKFIKTNFVLHCGDDDYFHVKNLEILLKKLKKKDKNSSIAGLSYLCEISENKTLNFSKYLALHPILQKNPYQRLKYIHRNYSNLLWFIIPKEVFFDSYKNSSKKLKLKVLYDELIINYTLAIHAKFYLTNIPYLIRIVGHNSSGQTLHKKKIKLSEFKKGIKKFKLLLLNSLKLKNSNVEIQKLDRDIKMNYLLKNKDLFIKKKNNNFLKYIIKKSYHIFFKEIFQRYIFLRKFYKNFSLIIFYIKKLKKLN